MKGLFIGINYIGTENELSGCVNDVKTIIELYKKTYRLTDVRLLTDYDELNLPTRRNILENVKWLVTNNMKGDQLFFHYSGHGSSVLDKNKDEKDGFDECIIPLDYSSSGVIVDDELKELMVKQVGDAHLFSVIDACHSGTMLDLPYSYLCNEKVIVANENTETYNVVLLSGCKDNQTSADTIEKINGQYINCGALTWALCNVIGDNGGISFINLIKEIRNILATSKYTQIPQLSFGTKPNLCDPVVKIV